MIVLFTDFGAEGPYLGQMEAVLYDKAPDLKVINGLSDAPVAEPRLSAYLLAALCQRFPEGTVFLCVVDPGVGGERLPVALQAAGRWFVGPENGLFNTLALHAERACWWMIDWHPAEISASFHGRDLFAPIAARIAIDDYGELLRPYRGPDLTAWPADLAEIIYIDHYGNGITGWRYGKELEGKTLLIGGHKIHQAQTFCAVPEGEALWYQNSLGLTEIAVNRGRADEALGLTLGMPFYFAI